MAIAVEINVVLWIMIGCALAEIAQLAEYLY
jgi:hypothetical protein